MSRRETVTIQHMNCARAGGQPATIEEERVYLTDDRLPDVAPAYRVVRRTCSLAAECNLNELHCQLSYLNPPANTP